MLMDGKGCQIMLILSGSMVIEHMGYSQEAYENEIILC